MARLFPDLPGPGVLAAARHANKHQEMRAPSEGSPAAAWAAKVLTQAGLMDELLEARK